MNIIKKIIKWWNDYWTDFENEMDKLTPEQRFEIYESIFKRGI